MSTLYELTAEWREIADALESDPDMTPEIVADTLAGVECQWKEKAAAVARMAENLRASAAAKADAAKEMKARADYETKRAASLVEYLLREMEAAGVKKIDAADIRASVRNNPPSVEIDDGAELPDEYLRVIPEKREPDKKAIGSALKAGAVIEGARLRESVRLEIGR